MGAGTGAGAGSSPSGSGVPLLVLKDPLLTDSMLLEEFPVAVKHEHSYSLGSSVSSGAAGSTSTAAMTAGSDGDSMPSSPISLQDGKLPIT